MYDIDIFKRFLSLYEGSCCHGNNTVYVLQDVTPRRTVTRWQIGCVPHTAGIALTIDVAVLISEWNHSIHCTNEGTFLRTHLFDMVYSLRDVVCLAINEFLYPSNTVVKMQTVSTLDFEQYFYHIGSWISRLSCRHLSRYKNCYQLRLMITISIFWNSI